MVCLLYVSDLSVPIACYDCVSSTPVPNKGLLTAFHEQYRKHVQGRKQWILYRHI